MEDFGSTRIEDYHPDEMNSNAKKQEKDDKEDSYFKKKIGKKRKDEIISE